jgi:glycosyltransferase involved in cell wall biosynthesis
MSNIRLIHLVGNSRYGGGALIILPLALRAKAEGWQVDILTTDSVFQEVIRKSAPEIGIVNLDVIRRATRPLWDLRAVLRLTRFLRSHPYTIVHTHTSKGGLVGRLAAALAGIPVIVHTVHGFAFHEMSSFAARLLYSTIERLSAHWCDGIACVSRFHRDWASQLGIGRPGQVLAIPNGLAPDRVQIKTSRAETRATLGLAPAEWSILATGRLAEQKGFAYLIRAAAILRDRLARPFHVLIAGEGELRGPLEELTRALGLSRQVTFLGFRRDVGDLLAAADLVVLPSLWEGLSIALLEAMAAGKPIVTTRIGSNLEVIIDEESGLLVDPADAEQLAQAIIRCVSDPTLCESLGKKAAQRFSAEYTHQQMLESYMNLYRELMGAKNAARFCTPVAA